MKRIGMAWTDPLQIAITPLETCLKADFDTTLDDLLTGGEVTQVVIGLPTHKDGNLTYVGNKVMKLLKKWEKQYTNIEFHTIDETFTSQDAVQVMIQMGINKKRRREKERIDQMSAVLILKSFLAKIN